jgi:hypothetical protein
MVNKETPCTSTRSNDGWSNLRKLPIVCERTCKISKIGNPLRPDQALADSDISRLQAATAGNCCARRPEAGYVNDRSQPEMEAKSGQGDDVQPYRPIKRWCLAVPELSW